MRSLFLKIFCWFLGAQLLIALALFALAFATQRGYDDRFRTAIGDNLEARARASAIVYETGGLQALRQAWRFPPASGHQFGHRAFGGPRGPMGSGNGDFTPGDFGEPPPDGQFGGPGPGGPGPASFGSNDDFGPGGPGGPEDHSSASFFVWYDAKHPVVPQITTPQVSNTKGKPGQLGTTTSTTPTPLPTMLPKKSGPLLLAGPALSDSVTPIVQQAFAGREGFLTDDDGYSWLARRVRISQGHQYVAVVMLRPNGVNMRGWWRLDEQSIPRFIVIALTLGAVCFALARYITDPAIKLRRATQQFAAGDLSVRVGNQMGNRRDELADLGHDFDVMAERIEELLVSERRLLGDISHELRSPLARLQLALELAEETAEGPTREYLSRIEEEAGELNAMIGQLLTLAKLENAIKMSSDTKATIPIALDALVEHIVEDADFEARGRGGRVILVENEPCQLMGNGELLHRAVENVVRNAILYSPAQPRVEVSLRCGANTADGSAVISVRDFGYGVPNEALSQLFRPFYRVDAARTPRSGGTGLGLSITQRAVQFHGGEVNAFNAQGGGLLVEIRLPLSLDLDLEPEQQPLKMK